jgi:hypothetical protein
MKAHEEGIVEVIIQYYCYPMVFKEFSRESKQKVHSLFFAFQLA